MASARSFYRYLRELLANPRTAWIVIVVAAILAYNAITLPSRTTELVISQRYNQWWSHLHNGQYSRAYAMMAPQYRAEFTEEQFYRTFIKAGEEWLRPHSGQKIDRYHSRATIFPRDSFSEGNGGPEYEFLKINGEWYMTGTFRYVYGKRNHLMARN
jgi:hypothetical protein